MQGTLTYDKLIEKHNISAVLGASFEKNKSSFVKGWGEGFFNEVLTNITNATVFTGASSFETGSGLSSYFGRVNYDFDDKYLLTVSARVDGSSKFAPDNQYAFFPAAAIAWRISNEDFLSDDSQTLDNGTTNNFSSDKFGNDLNFKLNDLFLGVHYKFRAGIFTLKQGAYLHNYNWNLNKQTQKSNNKWIVLPDFLAKIEFNKSKKLQLNYSLKTSFSDASKLADNFYLRSYNSVFKGNENLENNLYHNARIYYSRFSLYRGLMLFASVNYNKQIKGVRNTVDFNDVNQFLTVKMFDFPSETLRGNIHLEKSIKQIKYKFDVGFNNSKYIQELNNNLQTNKNNSYDYEIGFETLFDNFPTIEVGLKRDIGRFISSNSTSKFITTEPFITLDYDFLKGFVFNFDYKQSNYQNKTLKQKNTYEIANATLSYKNEDSAWSYTIKAQNLFNTQFKQSNRFSDYVVSDTKTFILPRIVMFSIGYNL